MKTMVNKEKNCFRTAATEQKEEALRRLGFLPVEDEAAKAKAAAEAESKAKKAAEAKAKKEAEA